MLTVAYDEIAFADDRRQVRARPNGAGSGGRFAAGWLLRLALLRPDMLRLARTEDALGSGRPFVYPLELTRAGLASFGADGGGLAAGIPSAVLDGARRGRTVIVVWLAHEAAPLELNPAGTVWLYDVIELFIIQNALPTGAVWFLTGTVSSLDDFAQWLNARGLYLPEAAELHAMTVFPCYAQAAYRANERGWDVAWVADGEDGAARAWTVPLSDEAFRARYVTAADANAERSSTTLRENRFLCLNDGLELHRQIVLSTLQAIGYLDDSLASFGAASIDLNDRCAFQPPGMADLQEQLRAGWLAIHARLPLSVDDPSAYRRSYLSIVSEASFEGYPLVDDRLMAAIVNRHPFIRVGSPDSLRYLRALGFRTFDRVIDESYDRSGTFAARMMRVLGQIEATGRSRTALRDLYVACLPELEHNWAHLVEGRHQLEATMRELDHRLGTA